MEEEQINESEQSNASEQYDEENISYEEEQLQMILMKELREKQINEERQLKESQTKEYLESLKIDETLNIPIHKENSQFEEVSIEEMRRIRLLRFNN